MKADGWAVENYVGNLENEEFLKKSSTELGTICVKVVRLSKCTRSEDQYIAPAVSESIKEYPEKLLAKTISPHCTQ
jgi:hypothetical protein